MTGWVADAAERTLSKAVEPVAALAARSAAKADARGRLAPEVVRAVLDCGFARHFVPARWGGSQGSFADASHAAALLGRACPSAAWLASLAATLGRIAGYLPAEGQHRLWERGPDALVVGSLLPLGAARPVPGGWLVSGSWPYMSSIEDSHWAIVLARCAPTAEPRFFAVHRDAYRIERTWSSLGMRATGSHTLLLDGCTVPARLSFARADLDLGAAAASDLISHTAPLEAVAGLAFVPPILGAAQTAVETWAALIEGRFEAGRLPAAERAAYDVTLCRSAGEVRAAELLVDGAARRADAGAWTPLAVAENARDAALAADLLTTATERLLRSAGTAVLSDGSQLQRLWRDIHSGASHVILGFSRAAAGYARARRAHPPPAPGET